MSELKIIPNQIYYPVSIAQMLGVTLMTVHNWIRQGKKGIKLKHSYDSRLNKCILGQDLQVFIDEVTEV